MIKIQYKIISDILIMDFEGELDSINLAENFKKINGLIDEHPEKEVLFNFHGVSFVNSTAIGQIMDVHGRLMEKGRSLHISNIYNTVENTLMFVGMFRFVKKYSSEETAIERILHPELPDEEEMEDDLFSDILPKK